MNEPSLVHGHAVIMIPQLYRAEGGFVSNKYIPPGIQDFVHLSALQLVQLCEYGYHQINYTKIHSGMNNNNYAYTLNEYSNSHNMATVEQ